MLRLEYVVSEKNISFIRIGSYLPLKIDVVRICPSEPSLRTGVVPSPKEIEARLNVPFFEGELLPYSVAAGITHRRNIAFWERSEKPPRSDVLPKMAQALGVTVEDLLIVGHEKPLKKKAAKSNCRPAGKVREVFERV